jgi:hypothetical protein
MTISFNGKNFSQLESFERLGSKFGAYSIGATVKDSDEQVWLAVIGGPQDHAMDKAIEFTTTNRDIIAFDRDHENGCLAANETKGNVNFTIYVVTKPCGYKKSCVLLYGQRAPGLLAKEEAGTRCAGKSSVLTALQKSLNAL